jgi:hypothetical protein
MFAFYTFGLSLDSKSINAVIVWTCEHEHCVREQWIEFLWTTQNLWRIFLAHKSLILHVYKNIPSTWIKYYIGMARIFF